VEKSEQSLGSGHFLIAILGQALLREIYFTEIHICVRFVQDVSSVIVCDCTELALLESHLFKLKCEWSCCQAVTEECGS